MSEAPKKCDDYSFGMVLLELVFVRRNFEPSAFYPGLCYFPVWANSHGPGEQVPRMVDQCLRTMLIEKLLS